MKTINFNGPLIGQTEVASDKSITHRAIILSSLAQGQSVIQKPLLGEDCLSTIDIFRRLGVTIDVSDVVTINSQGFQNFQEPTQVLYTGNSGTTTRLLAGLLSGLPFRTVLSGDKSIGSRPMDRVIEPLSKMNADIIGAKDNSRTPLIISPSTIRGIDYTMQVKSAQVKSALLLAGLFADGPVKIHEETTTRNHTEMMLPAYGIPLEVNDKEIYLPARSIEHIKTTDIVVPGDISSAAFLIVAALITKDSEVTLKNIGINPTRTGIIDVVQKMGGHIEISNINNTIEPSADIHVKYTERLKPIEISGDLIPRLIDEIPVIALLLSCAEGTSIIKDAEELKVKETNRIDTVVNELNQLGFQIEATEDGMIVHPYRKLTSGTVSSHGDHRIGMMLAVSTLLNDHAIEIDDFESVDVSFPGFLETFEKLGVK